MPSNILIDPNDKPLVNPAHDRFLDSTATRRELQDVINHFSKHLDALYATLDTQHIVLNCVGEKLNITRDELLAFVEKKRQEMEDKKKKQEAANEQSN